MGVQLLSGLWLGLAVWCVGALLQAWVPLWQVLLLGLASRALVGALPARLIAKASAAADFVAVAALWLMSVIPVGAAKVLAAAAVFTAAGLALDRLTWRMSPPGRRGLLALPVIVLVLLGITVTQVKDFGWRLFARQPQFLLRLALIAPDPGARSDLVPACGTWILRTRTPTPLGTAILLHGNDPLASRQPAALALQGALMRAGYDVISLDHPGYGATPLPGADADWKAWDPTICPGRALDHLRSAGNARKPAKIVVAHSMGVDVALALGVSRGADIQAEYLFGGSIDRPRDPDNGWIKEFFQQRGTPCCMSLATIRRVRDEFYSGADRFALALPPGHPAVNFVRFGIEYDDVARVRQLLYSDIPPPKALCDLSGVTHYFNTLSLRLNPLLLPGFVLVDTLAVKRTARVFSRGQQTTNGCHPAKPLAKADSAVMRQTPADSAASTLPTSMRAAAIDHAGGPEALTIHTLPLPPVGPKDVLIAVRTAGVSIWDADIRQRLMYVTKPAFPLVMGTDGAGFVAAVGSGVTTFKVGEAVYGYCWDNASGGFYAEYAAVPASCVAHVPKGVSLDSAGALGSSGLTALQGIDGALRVRPGERLIIHGASGGVGTLAIQLAKLRGALVLATASGDDGIALARRLGADAAVDGRHGNIAAAIHSFAPHGADALLALAAGEGLQRCIEGLHSGGRVAFPRGIGQEPQQRSGITIVAYDAISGPEEVELARLNQAVEARKFEIPIPAEYPLAQANRAHERLAAGHILGKIVLRVR